MVELIFQRKDFEIADELQTARLRDAEEQNKQHGLFGAASAARTLSVLTAAAAHKMRKSISDEYLKETTMSPSSLTKRLKS